MISTAHPLCSRPAPKACILLLMLVLGTGLTAQREAARKHIRQMKGSTLLVRLQDRTTLITSLEDRGLESQVSGVIEERDEENADIMDSFLERFDFCRVYFFYASESQLILDKQFDSIAFVGPDLKVDQSIRPVIDTYYIAEFTHLTQDTRDKVKNNSYRDGDEKGGNKEPKYVGGTEIGGHALIIMDSDFEPIRSPFPFYTKTFKGLPFSRKYKKVVRLMNEKLTEFYQGS